MLNAPLGATTRRGWKTGLAISCAVVCALAAGEASAAAAKKPYSPGRNIYGNWLGIGYNKGELGPYRNTNWAPNPTTLFTPVGAAESKRLDNPQSSQEALCEGTPYGGASDIFMFQFVKAENEILRIMEAGGGIRRFRMNRREHPADFAPYSLGDSIAHWEGDTLVVDTVKTTGGGSRPLNGFAFNAVYEVAGDRDPRLPISNQLHMVERITLKGAGDILEIVTTIEDAKNYNQPFSRTQYLQRRSDLEVQQASCRDPNARPDAEGYAQQAKAR